MLIISLLHVPYYTTFSRRLTCDLKEVPEDRRSLCFKKKYINSA